MEASENLCFAVSALATFGNVVCVLMLRIIIPTPLILGNKKNVQKEDSGENLILSQAGQFPT